MGSRKPAEGKSKPPEGKSKPAEGKSKPGGRKIQVGFFRESNLFKAQRPIRVKNLAPRGRQARHSAAARARHYF